MAPVDDSRTLGVLPAPYQLLRASCAPALRRLFGLDVSGLERLPEKEPFILASNHHNYLDGIVLGVAVPRPISFLVMPRVYHASPLHPSFHRRIGSVPVVPAAVTGTYEALSGRRFYVPRLTRLAVRFGEPLRFHGAGRGPLHRRGTHADREDITRRIMSHIAALLDTGLPAPARRGEA